MKTASTTPMAKFEGRRAVEVIRPRLAVIIPVYKHSALLAEALESVLSQVSEFGIIGIIVNDGCPFPETHEICRDFAVAYPNRLIYVRKKNGGLSSARNTGVSYILDNCPTVEAIYFLDADNRLTSRAMKNALSELDTNPLADWIYPSIDVFGLREAWDFSGEYSIIRNLYENICEAGSLVRRRVFEAGLRFDESMTSGYEDWDFWLSAAEAGFRGRCLTTFGFQYRRRPESMLAGSSREDQAIRAYIRKKHQQLFRIPMLVSEEHRLHPRYAIYLQDVDRVLVGTDPTQETKQISFGDFEELCWRAI